MAPPPRPLGRGLMILLAVSAFAVAGTIHYQTPMLAAFAAEFGADPAAAGWVATLSFGGFLLGTILFVPRRDPEGTRLPARHDATAHAAAPLTKRAARR